MFTHVWGACEAAAEGQAAAMLHAHMCAALKLAVAETTDRTIQEFRFAGTDVALNT